jgi:glycosidase
MITISKQTKMFVVLVVLMLSVSIQNFAQPRVKKVVMQAFWWDYWNNNFRFKWADYLTELAPRLKALGIDAIWVPPNYKTDGPGSNGYNPFDQFDLGDKHQKGETLSDTIRTRSGNKDELLRMIAVMHANGIEVIQDIVLNHCGGAGDKAGAGGRDFTALSTPYKDNTNGIAGSDYFKNFRYVCYGTPKLNETQNDYWTRKGRWSKNLHNFYPNQGNNLVNTNPINTAYFGPDNAFETNSIGQSTNIPTTGSVTINGITKPYFNPVQTSNYMANNAKNWIVWYKKQTGADGFRWDAVKHFPFNVQQDLTFALKYQSDFASGGNEMFNVGEWVGTIGDLDYYASSLIKTGTPVESGIANEQMSGGFDFGLRAYGSSGNDGAIYPMVLQSGGSFDMQSIPGKQQTQAYRYQDVGGKRIHKTVSFVNSHDTYRPVFSSTGNFSKALGDASGWDVANELGGNGNHIDPREPRFAAAYATIAALDGNPCFYIEDVFDYFSKNRRWTHLPTNTDSLPLRTEIANIMQAHQKLAFKDGDYAVPTAITGASAPFYLAGASGDHLVVDRTGKAILGLSDAYSTVANNSADQQVWVTANPAWATGTVLYDYSGAHGITTSIIQPDRRVLIKTAPCGHTIPGAFGHGYSIWAPYPSGTPSSVNDLFNSLTTYNQSRIVTTTQEWEMADDLGDSHCASLGQGGSLPANSTNQRVCGKIFVKSGTTINYKISPEIAASDLTVGLFDLDGNRLSEVSGLTSAASMLSGTYSSATTGWVVVKIRNSTNTSAAQKCWVNVTYTAPAVVNTRDAANDATTRASIWTGNKATSDITDCGNWEEGKIPNANSTIIIPPYASPAPLFQNSISGRILGLTATAGNYKTVNNAIVKISGAAATNLASIATGEFKAINLNTGVYVVKPSKNNDVTKNNGVSSIDMVLTTRHILGLTPFNSAYKIVAADVNNNKTVTNIDIIFMKRLILGLDTTFTGNRLWAFVDSAYKFPDTTNPFPYKDSIVLSELTKNKSNQTFIGVKLGDVNYDWNANTARGKSIDNVELLVNNKLLIVTDKQVSIPILVNNFKDLIALQYTLHFDNSKYEFVAIKNNKFNIEFNIAQANKNGNIAMLWANEKGEETTLDNDTELFTLILNKKSRANSNQSLEKNEEVNNLQLTINNNITDIEAWDNNFVQHNVVLKQINKLTNQTINPTESNSFTVTPSPTKGEVTIIYNSKVAKTVSMQLINAEGTTMVQQNFEAKKGTNEYHLNLKKNTKLTTGFYVVKMDEMTQKIMVD